MLLIQVLGVSQDTWKNTDWLVLSVDSERTKCGKEVIGLVCVDVIIVAGCWSVVEWVGPVLNLAVSDVAVTVQQVNMYMHQACPSAGLSVTPVILPASLKSLTAVRLSIGWFPLV